MARDRGIEKIEEYSGDFLRIIENTIKKKGKVRILEAGCGHGVAMIGFVKRFGAAVEIIGFNLNRQHGTIDRMKKQAIDKKLFTRTELKKLKNLPKIVYCDASKKLPFESNRFDFIYSRASMYLFDDKVYFLEECNRVLETGGLMRVTPGFGLLSAPEGSKNAPKGIEIYDSGMLINPKRYFKRFRGVKIVDNGKSHYFEIKKQPVLNFRLRLITFIDYNFLWHKWMGVKSIYTTQRLDTFVPHWKS